ncbi:hypothetical protein EVAR_33591_1 [Eumeta japonica]|uniref:Uncharacterized protein n=1 Tax=Eumeta variegata TaxID=151549 RepID=A0A4C1WCN1_EUMVA|nr:hypothetical protein EVAR_33591_1 [Eumeta japonica]
MTNATYIKVRGREVNKVGAEAILELEQCLFGVLFKFDRSGINRACLTAREHGRRRRVDNQHAYTRLSKTGHSNISRIVRLQRGGGSYPSHYPGGRYDTEHGPFRFILELCFVYVQRLKALDVLIHIAIDIDIDLPFRRPRIVSFQCSMRNHTPARQLIKRPYSLDERTIRKLRLKFCPRNVNRPKKTRRRRRLRVIGRALGGPSRVGRDNNMAKLCSITAPGERLALRAAGARARDPTCRTKCNEIESGSAVRVVFKSTPYLYRRGTIQYKEGYQKGTLKFAASLVFEQEGNRGKTRYAIDFAQMSQDLIKLKH